MDIFHRQRKKIWRLHSPWKSNPVDPSQLVKVRVGHDLDRGLAPFWTVNENLHGGAKEEGILAVIHVVGLGAATSKNSEGQE